MGFLLNTPYQAGGSTVTAPEEQEKLEYLLTILLPKYSRPEADSYKLIQNRLKKDSLMIITRNLVRQQVASPAEAKKPELI